MRLNLRFVKRLIPSPYTLVLLALWLCLAAIAGHMLGAYLIPRLDSQARLMALVLGATIGIPILMAPRPTWEPTGWGVGLNLVVLLIMAMFARSTMSALQQNGDWMIKWVAQRQWAPRYQQLAVNVRDTSRWLIERVPIDKLEESLGPSDVKITWDQKSSDIAGGGNADSEEVVADLSAKLKQGVETATDQKTYDEQVRSPDAQAIKTMENRLLEVVNLERTKQGLTFLTIRDDLNRLAKEHSVAMCDKGFLSHVDPQGKGPEARASEAHLANTRVFELIGKVVDAHDVPRELVNAFIKTPGDRARMFDREDEYQAIGVGMACQASTCYGTVVFQ